MTNHTNHEKRMRIMLINLILVFVVTTLIAFCIDGFLLHPIPSQGYGETFSLRETDTVYADATILEAHHVGWAKYDIFMVEHNDVIHMLYFARHPMTDRHALKDDVIVEPGFTGGVTVGTKYTQVTMWLENGEKVNSSGMDYGLKPGGVYLGIAFIVTAVESVILWQILKKKYPNK